MKLEKKPPKDLLCHPGHQSGKIEGIIRSDRPICQLLDQSLEILKKLFPPKSCMQKIQGMSIGSKYAAWNVAKS